MFQSRISRHGLLSFSFTTALALALLAIPLATSCSALVTPMSDDDALRTLRELTKGDRLPLEGVVAEIENRFAKTRAGALAKLLRARIRFQGNDFVGAATILDSPVFKEKTKLADYALWLRGRSLQSAGRHADAMKAFATLVRDYPTSLRLDDARVLWANSASASGQFAQVADILSDLNNRGVPAALLATARAYETAGDQTNALRFYRRLYFFGAGSADAKEAEAKLTAAAQPLFPQNAEEALVRADKLFAVKNYSDAATAYATLATSYPNAVTPAVLLRRLIVAVNVRNFPDAQNFLNQIPLGAPEKEEAYYNLVVGSAKAKLWPNARAAADEMRQKFPAGKLTPKAWIDAGMAARDARASLEEGWFLQSAMTAFPNAVDVAKAQFEVAWLQHDARNYAQSAQMLTDHLARYADKDSSNRGKAGYWAARDSEVAGRIAEACALYDATVYRYGANWYGHLAFERLAIMRGRGQCQSAPKFAATSPVTKAVANLKVVTVAPETAGPNELERAAKSDDLAVVGLFDWSIDELKEAQKKAGNSPKINLALAKHYRLKGDQVNALLSLAKSYPDYAQMFPEELGREEWDIFYPLTNWNDIKYWATQRRLDPHQVAGFIRQETIFDARAKSGANAYGLMQLLIPTARAVAKKYNSSLGPITAELLFQPAANIELGTAYIRDQFDKFGRVEYVAIAYNAGPGRVGQWQASVPGEMDAFVENIPFKETKGYVQGIIRNSAQYERLYDDNGNFKANVGTRPLRAEIDSKPKDQLAIENPEVVLSGDGEE